MNTSLAFFVTVNEIQPKLSQYAAEILEVAAQLADDFSLTLVDFVSQDDTEDLAEQLMKQYPQVRMISVAGRSSGKQTLDTMVAASSADIVLVREGLDENTGEWLRRAWQQRRITDRMSEPATMEDLSAVREIHQHMEQAHQSLPKSTMPGPISAPTQSASAADQPLESEVLPGGAATPPPAMRRKGVGSIPPLPRPNFGQVIADFALGE